MTSHGSCAGQVWGAEAGGTPTSGSVGSAGDDGMAGGAHRDPLCPSRPYGTFWVPGARSRSRAATRQKCSLTWKTNSTAADSVHDQPRTLGQGPTAGDRPWPHPEPAPGEGPSLQVAGKCSCDCYHVKNGTAADGHLKVRGLGRQEVDV